jgi:hypothetical protein
VGVWSAIPLRYECVGNFKEPMYHTQNRPVQYPHGYLEETSSVADLGRTGFICSESQVQHMLGIRMQRATNIRIFKAARVRILSDDHLNLNPRLYSSSREKEGIILSLRSSTKNIPLEMKKLLFSLLENKGGWRMRGLCWDSKASS